MIHVITTDEHNEPRVKIGGTTPTAGEGEVVHSFMGDTMPVSFAPNTYLIDSTAPVFQPHHLTPNPNHYRAEQQAVFAWARKNIHDPAYLAYGLRGSTERASIFHVFAVINVMAALKKENITGDNWGMVKSNLVGWKDFVSNILVSDWTNSQQLSYITFIATPTTLFPDLQPDFRMRSDVSGDIIIDPTLIAQVGDTIPVRS